MPTVDSDTNVHPSHYKEGGKSQSSELHLSPVGDDVSEVGGYQGVNPSAGPSKIHVWVGDGHQQ